MRGLVVAVIAMALAACAAGASAPAGGIHGTVTAGPTCPVEHAGTPCPPAPWSGTIRATAADGTTYDASTDAEGSYRLALPDGTYAVAPVTSGGPQSAKPVTVTVQGGATQTVDLQVDTGIR
jgi:Carboxypeptidase regulatory-like domain